MKNKYLLGSVSLRETMVTSLDGSHVETETRHCLVGVYLQERHPEVLDKHYSNEEEGEHGYAYQYVFDNCTEDMKAMAGSMRALALAADCPELGDEDYHLVYRANDAGLPLDVATAALKAVGIDVELEDRRPISTEARVAWELAQECLAAQATQ